MEYEVAYTFMRTITVNVTDAEAEGQSAESIAKDKARDGEGRDIMEDINYDSVIRMDDET